MSNFLEVRTSGIAKGENGLFAKQFIPSGSILFSTFTKNTRVKSKDWEGQFTQTQCNQFVNHSENPNTESFYLPSANAMYRRTIRDVRPGEEITSNYQQTVDLIKKMGYSFSSNWLWFKK